ncbi:MAG: hypothetical protein BWX77_01165 [Bacteroidetes bacterium ADurb.Bin090]|nr:MAG: hypothetical protein BWX77_01165 [Bacteroidetes bacterium ADurb.Bin090]
MQAPKLEFVPFGLEPVVHIHIFEVNLNFGNVDLNIATGFEFELFAFGQFHYKLLDKGSHVVIGNHLAFPFLDAQNFFGNLNFKVVLHFDLASQSPLFLLFSPAEKTGFCG